MLRPARAGKRNAGPCLRTRSCWSHPKGLSWRGLPEQDHLLPEVPLTCDGHIGPRLLLPPGWYKCCDVCVAPFQKPVHSQQDAPAGEDFLVPMAGGKRRVGVSPRGWLICHLLGLSRRDAGPAPAPALAQPITLRLGPEACIPSRITQGLGWPDPGLP